MGANANETKESGGLMETVRVVIQALLLALVVRVFLFQPFNIPSGSMIPTLLIGDYLFVSKFSYGYSKHSFPWSPPLFNGRIFSSEPERGDVVVFKLPKDNETDYIKRLVGLPGDKIQMIGGVLQINGQPVKRKRIDDYIQNAGTNYEQAVTRYEETLPNGVTYTTNDLQQNAGLDDTRVFAVPEGHYFMMGDNRDNSTDSRVLTEVGYVPRENLVGHAKVLFFSIGENASLLRPWEWPGEIRWSRLFNAIK
ncbi:MAG: signal peptidase I [Hyphomicrobiales bacterium]|nr:signal peptidase I [Hyphomicrobiales bacterium]